MVYLPSRLPNDVGEVRLPTPDELKMCKRTVVAVLVMRFKRGEGAYLWLRILIFEGARSCMVWTARACEAARPRNFLPVSCLVARWQWRPRVGVCHAPPLAQMP